MRAALAILVLCAAALPAFADSKTRGLARDYHKELAACQKRGDGVARVAAGAQALVEAGQHQHEADLAALRAGLAQVQAYCAELTATLDLLDAAPDATYRSLERKLDEQDNKIRRLRVASKQVLDDLSPVIARLVPQINARAGAAAPPPRQIHVGFPSGRAIDVPVLAGTYRTAGSEAIDVLEYAEAKASATVTARLAPSTTCEQQRRAFTAPDVSELAATDATKPLELAWYITYTRRARRLRVACRATGADQADAIVVMLDEPLAATAWPELAPVLAAMIAARP